MSDDSSARWERRVALVNRRKQVAVDLFSMIMDGKLDGALGSLEMIAKLGVVTEAPDTEEAPGE